MRIDKNREIALTQVYLTKQAIEAGIKINNIKQNSSIKRQGQGTVESRKWVAHSGFVVRRMVTLRLLFLTEHYMTINIEDSDS